MKNLIKLFAFVDERRLTGTNSVGNLQQSIDTANSNIEVNDKQLETNTAPASRGVTTPNSTERIHRYNSVLFKPERYNLIEIEKSQKTRQESANYSQTNLLINNCEPTGSSSSLTISELGEQNYVTETPATRSTDQVTLIETIQSSLDHRRSSPRGIKSSVEKQRVTNYFGGQAYDDKENRYSHSNLNKEDEHDDNENKREDQNNSWLNISNYLPTFYYHCQQGKSILDDKQLLDHKFSITKSEPTTITTTVNDSQRAASNRSNNYKTINLVEQQYRVAIDEEEKEHEEVEPTREAATTKTTATTTTTTTTIPITIIDVDDVDGWVLLNEETVIDHPHPHSHHHNHPHRHYHHHTHQRHTKQHNYITGSSSSSSSPSSSYLTSQNNTRKLAQQKQQMALNGADIELIRASWVLARKDTASAGVLLFKGLFTKFPDYLRFFPNFSDLDIEQMRENKRLLKHAVKVIDTVTFVVDSIGDESKSKELNDALVNLVRSHLRRKIGLTEFRNLGIVIIDFICDLNINNNKIEVEGSTGSAISNSIKAGSYHQSSTGSSQEESETMTSALDKIRASTSSSSSSDEESFATGANVGDATSVIASSQPESSRPVGGRSHKDSAYESINHQSTSEDHDDSRCSSSEDSSTKLAKLDTNLLVAAWTKLYSIILDLVKREEEQANNN